MAFWGLELAVFTIFYGRTKVKSAFAALTPNTPAPDPEEILLRLPATVMNDAVLES